MNMIPNADDGHPQLWLSPTKALAMLDVGPKHLRLDQLPISSERSDPIQRAQQYERFGFRINNINFLIDRDIPCQVISSPKIYRLPNLKKWIPGVVNIRGNFVPVVDVMVYIDPETDVDSGKKLMLLGEGADLVGLLVDGFPSSEVFGGEEKTTKAVTVPEAIVDYVRRVFEREQLGDSHTWFDLDREHFLQAITSTA